MSSLRDDSNYSQTAYPSISVNNSDDDPDDDDSDDDDDDTEEPPFLQDLKALSTDSDWREEVKDITEHVKKVWPFVGSPWLGKLLDNPDALELLLSKCKRGYARPLKDMLTKTRQENANKLA
jgi:hypothetical protein